LKSGLEATQEAALDSLFLLRQAWPSCTAEVGKAQAVAAAETIPILQDLIQSGPPRFQEKAELLLQCLPGTLLVTIKRGINLKQSVGNPRVAQCGHGGLQVGFCIQETTTIYNTWLPRSDS
jgi:hypothetical protein